ncbi:cytochrome-c peroxidase [Flavipsychrobacter stenotrophus]|nr:cytochrome c peroxidase [Flavipsychrobacter stenotrophus]
MSNKKLHICLAILALMLSVTVFNACKKDINPDAYTGPTPYLLVIPTGLPRMDIPANNPMTQEGVALGRKLFYDPILSGNRTMSCASCHNQAFSFTDSSNQYSIGIDGLAGTRNAMNLVNLGYQKKFFWDGGAADLESQVIGPIQNPVEMHENLANAIHKLNTDLEYPTLFKKAFGGDTITTSMLMRAIAQFERTMISGNSKYDQYVRGSATLTAQELRGMELYQDPAKGDCTHCHAMGSTFSDFEFRNNGVDSIYADAGRYKITLIGSDSGKFKTPSLRNIALTAPYMHDGRFTTLQQCLDHYNTGFHYSPSLDPVLSVSPKGRMTAQDMTDIIAFLHTLTDTSFINNQAFKHP